MKEERKLVERGSHVLPLCEYDFSGSGSLALPVLQIPTEKIQLLRNDILFGKIGNLGVIGLDAAPGGAGLGSAKTEGGPGTDLTFDI